MKRPPGRPLDDPKPRGRPRVDAHGNTVSTWLAPADHDKLIKAACQEEKTISALVRTWLKLKLR